MIARSDTSSKAGDATSAGTDTVITTDDQKLSGDERQKRGERIIQDHVLMGLVAGLIPGPAIDLAAGFGVQLTMLGRLAKLYGVPFRRDLAKNILTSLFGSLGGVGAGTIIASSLIKTIPVLGTALGFVGTGASMGGFTYAVGKLFQQHFEQGGTFDDLEPSAYRDYFREMFKRGKTVAADKADEAAEQARGASKSAKAASVAAGA